MAEEKINPGPEAPSTNKQEGVPFEIPVLPLQNTTLFPETMVPLAAGRSGSVAAVEAALGNEDKLLACISVRPDQTSDQDAKSADLFEVGTLVMIKRMERLEDTLHLILQGTARIRVREWVQEKPFLRARVQILPELEVKIAEEVEASKRNLQSLLQQALAYLPQVPPEVRTVVLEVEDPTRLAYFLGSLLSLGVEKEQQMLEANTVDDLMHLAHDFLASEVEIIRLRSKIATEAQREIDKEQRDYILRMQMKAIKRELGETEPQPEDAKGTTVKKGLGVTEPQPDYAKGTTGLTKIFVGHGRNPIWSRVVIYLKDELGLEVEAFETYSRTSEHIVDVLKGFLAICDAAVIVMTADDRTADGAARARQNVIHEIGLCQGRFGFDRVILLQQGGTEDFSNLAGLQTIRFSEKVEEGFYDLGRAILKLQRGTSSMRIPRMNTSIQLPVSLISQNDG
jgi:Lon protease-like protein/predicted nucleotide-binding protein